MFRIGCDQARQLHAKIQQNNIKTIPRVSPDGQHLNNGNQQFRVLICLYFSTKLM